MFTAKEARETFKENERLRINREVDLNVKKALDLIKEACEKSTFIRYTCDIELHDGIAEWLINLGYTIEKNATTGYIDDRFDSPYIIISWE